MGFPSALLWAGLGGFFIRGSLPLPAEVIRELLNVAHARIFDLPTSDLLDCSLRDARAFSDRAPLSLCGLEVAQNVVVDVFHAASVGPFLGLCNPQLGLLCK